MEQSCTGLDEKLKSIEEVHAKALHKQAEGAQR